MKKSYKKYIKLIVILLFIFISISYIFTTHSVFAALNSDTSGISKNATADVITKIIDLATGPLYGGISSLVTVIVALLFVIIWAVFIQTGITPPDGLGFPSVDNVIFNRIGFFDPNFINPPPDTVVSPVAYIKDIIAGFYYSFYVIAGTVFVIAALVIGIKLAITTVAAEKAQYKQAINNWLVGIVLLFTVHFLITGIFFVNEKMVEAISTTLANSKLVFETSAWKFVPVYGNTIGKLLTWFNPGGGTVAPVHFEGITGLIYMYGLEGVGGNLISIITCGLLIGQTIIVIVLYIKRLFYCIILGMLAPLVVAADVIKKSM